MKGPPDGRQPTIELYQFVAVLPSVGSGKASLLDNAEKQRL
jgi:hypothetical protein